MSAVALSTPVTPLALLEAWEYRVCPDAARFTLRWVAAMKAALAELNTAEATRYRYHFDLCLWFTGEPLPAPVLGYLFRELYG